MGQASHITFNSICYLVSIVIKYNMLCRVMNYIYEYV